MPKQTTTKKPITALRTRWTWPHYPDTIRWIQQQRDEAIKKDLAYKRFNRFRGMNATIVILSASTIEGFVTECLESFVNRFEKEDTMPERLKHDFLRRLESPNWPDRQALFRLATGKSITESLGGSEAPIVVAIDNLIKLRNCLAHAKPISYVSHGDKHADFDADLYDMEGKFADVENYLVNKKLIPKSDGYNVNDLLESKCVDFLAAQVKPYIDELLKTLPSENRFSVQHTVNVAFI